MTCKTCEPKPGKAIPVEDVYNPVCPDCEEKLLNQEPELCSDCGKKLLNMAQEPETPMEEIIKKLELLKYNEPLDREMRIVNMMLNSAIKIVKEVLEK